MGARGASRRHVVSGATRHERVRVRAERRRKAPGTMARAVRHRRARTFPRARRARSRARGAVRLRDLSRPRHHLRVGRRPCALAREARADARRGRHLVPAARRRHPDAAGDRAAPGRARVVAARDAHARGDHRVPYGIRRHASVAVPARSGNRTACRRRLDVDGTDGVLARDRRRRCTRLDEGGGRTPRCRVGQLSGQRRADDELLAPRPVPRTRARPRRHRRRRAVQPDDAGPRVQGRARDRDGLPA